MAIKDARFRASGIGTAETPGMRELQAHDDAGAGSRHQGFAEAGEIIAGALVDEQLIWIRASVMPDSDSLSSPHQPGAAAAKIPPAAECQIGGTAVRRSVPAFHWLNRESITN
jgi:hypothetical protein